MYSHDAPSLGCQIPGVRVELRFRPHLLANSHILTQGHSCWKEHVFLIGPCPKGYISPSGQPGGASSFQFVELGVF